MLQSPSVPSLAWLSADATDLATGRLLTYLAAMIGEQLPSADTVVRAALGAHLPHTEVAGLLAEAVSYQPRRRKRPVRTMKIHGAGSA